MKTALVGFAIGCTGLKIAEWIGLEQDKLEYFVVAVIIAALLASLYIKMEEKSI